MKVKILPSIDIDIENKDNYFEAMNKYILNKEEINIYKMPYGSKVSNTSKVFGVIKNIERMDNYYIGECNKNIEKIYSIYYNNKGIVTEISHFVK